MTILNCWNFSAHPRKNQVTALDWLEQQDAKYLFCEAPVGSGKSLIGLTYSKYLNGNSFILTPQRILQQQYERSFSKDLIASLYGRSNYSCTKVNSTCDIGNSLKSKCSHCPYKHAKELAMSNPNVVLNYTLAMLMFNHTDVFKPRKLMILDECHNTEDYLTEFNAVQTTQARSKKYGATWLKTKTLNEAISWVKNEYLPKVETHTHEFFKQNEEVFDKAGYELVPNDHKIIREYDGLLEHCDELNSLINEPAEIINDFYVLVHNEHSIKFKPLTGAINFHRVLEPKAERFLFMSSTILDHKAFCVDIGIDSKQSAFLSLGSEFPVENRPIFFMPKMKMNVNWSIPENASKRNEAIISIKSILDIHKDDSGIIHTSSFRIASWLVEELEGKVSHQILHHNPDSGDNRNSIIDAFTKSKRPVVLISPSITEGLDFKDDLSRFAIFAKVPFPFLGDQYIKRRMEISSEWYLRKAITDIIQGGGRVVRSPDDWGNTYILDSSFEYLFDQTKNIIPKWWLESFRTLK